VSLEDRIATGAPEAPGTAAMSPETDPCATARSAAQDACALADRMSALALATQERLRGARRAYDEHAGRRERAAAAADPRTVRAAKDEAQEAFRRARLAAADRGALEAAAREWLREVDRVNARTREAIRTMAREDAAEPSLLQAVERLGLEADGARIAAESAAEACRNARITLATCEERERASVATVAAASPSSVARAALEPASVAAEPLIAMPAPEPVASAGSIPPSSEGAQPSPAEPVHPPASTAAPAIFSLLEGDREILRRIAAALAEGDAASEDRWQAHLVALVEAVTERAIDSAALTFPEAHAFWGPYTQQQCREITAALAALGYRFDGLGGFADGRVPGQRELSLAMGYAGLDPMRMRIWPTEAEMARLFEDVHVESGRFVAEAAGDLTLGEMIDLLGRRAEDLSDLWNAWGRVRPLLLAPA
jgi:hypothetical protein